MSYTEAAVYSVATRPIAPNAGGQTAYIIRRHDLKLEHEGSIFVNEYLRVGEGPLYGAHYSQVFSLCSMRCWLQNFVTSGLGLSNAGPYVSLEWSFTFFWTARVDFSTHLLATNRRLISWSYPLWLGLRIPIDFRY